MKTKYVAYTTIILAIVGIYFSLDLLNGLRLVIETTSGRKSVDNFSTSERFLELWPLTLILGSVVAMLISAFFLWAFNTVIDTDTEELKTKLNKEIEDYNKLKKQSILDVDTANQRADNAFTHAYKKVELKVKNELDNIEVKKRELENEKLKLDKKESELERVIKENNWLVMQCKKETKRAKQKAKDHGNSLSRVNNILERLKTDHKYMKRFIAKNYE